MGAPGALLVMGVSGCGKSTVGALLASKLGWKFYDADDYHPEENRTKMRKGIPLNDQGSPPEPTSVKHPKIKSHNNTTYLTALVPDATLYWDRIPWLCNLHDILIRDVASGQHVVLACSALKKMYRDILIQGKDGIPQKCNDLGKEEKLPEVKLFVVHLSGSSEVICGRLLRRKGHFMPPELLQSQFDTLEPPSAPENFIQISVDKDLSEIIATITETLHMK